MILAAAFGACGGDAGPTASVTGPEPSGSFARLQNTVLTPSCAVSGCHVSASAAGSGNLVLTADVAYANLVGIRPSNLSAQRDGFRRVVPFKPDSSLLFQKTVLALAAHHSDYGNTMPVGTHPLQQGQIDFIRKWIEAGAPRTGDVVDTTLLANKTAQSGSAFVPLAPPPTGEGIQIRVDSFGVQSNFERELFVYRPLGNTGDIYVNRIQTAMRPMSHHLALFLVDPSMAPGFPCLPDANVIRDIRNADGSMNMQNMNPMSCQVFLGGAMAETDDYRFPAGVALRMSNAMSVDMNVHYVNRTVAEIPGEAYANFYTIPLAQVVHVASALNLPNSGFSLPPHQVTTCEKTFLMLEPTTIVTLSSHMHMLGTRFQIRIVGGARDGELVYESTDWEHPQTANFSQPIVLAKGEGLRSIITWNNSTDHVVTFGRQSTDEMGIIFGYYYH